jgi:methylated-DNA-[protein]-cysteine S-methyltransferase
MEIAVMIATATLASPIGPLTLAAHGERVCLLHFGPDSADIRKQLARWYPGDPIVPSDDPAGAAAVLRDYFAGDVEVLDRVAVEMNGTPFQQRVWAALRRVRAGTTVAYSDIARAIRAPSAVRAVGAANGANPVAVIVPCHRIIGSNGTLTGYGGGLERKEWLLRHEGVRSSLFS